MQKGNSLLNNQCITLVVPANIKGAILSLQGQYYYIDYGPYLESLEHLVDHYIRHSYGGLPAELQRPIKPPYPVKDNEVSTKFQAVIFFYYIDNIAASFVLY